MWEATQELTAECLIWGLLSAGTLSSDPEIYQEQLITETVVEALLPAVIKGSNAQSDLGKGIIKLTLKNLSVLTSGEPESSAGM